MTFNTMPYLDSKQTKVMSRGEIIHKTVETPKQFQSYKLKCNAYVQKNGQFNIGVVRFKFDDYKPFVKSSDVPDNSTYYLTINKTDTNQQFLNLSFSENFNYLDLRQIGFSKPFDPFQNVTGGKSAMKY